MRNAKGSSGTGLGTTDGLQITVVSNWGRLLFYAVGCIWCFKWGFFFFLVR